MSAYEVAVIGLGAMGSAAVHALARRGAHTLGLDRFSPPHALGSSHGETRIIREAYFEDPRYVPLVQRAYELWSDLERATGRTLMVRTGGLMIGREDGVLVRGARASADMHHLPHERLEATELRRRFPVLQPSDEMVAIWEPRAGVLFPEACVAAHLELAEKEGADLHRDGGGDRCRARRRGGGGAPLCAPPPERARRAADPRAPGAGRRHARRGAPPGCVAALRPDGGGARRRGTAR